ncbi:hypothetical protein HHL28_15185 [Aerophototrophica crusticola]|uniref:Uncharacterized protein n=1 Tax=Aerophototrophica crusticola TaxID=1709002 RepID=A0A858RA18_9PROT|nr:hypothetical protein HHL28_15185 [Rhodospirillaceae bacterium B3]
MAVTPRTKVFALTILVVFAALFMTAWMGENDPVFFRTDGPRTIHCEDEAGQSVPVYLDFSDAGRTVAVQAGSLSAVLQFAGTRLLTETYTDGATTLSMDPEIILSGPGITRVGPCH